jgi:hypothetical protein
VGVVITISAVAMFLIVVGAMLSVFGDKRSGKDDLTGE